MNGLRRVFVVLHHRDFREARITTRWVENDFLRTRPPAAEHGALLPA